MVFDMKKYFLGEPGNRKEINPALSFTGIDGNRYPPSALASLSDEELAFIGVTKEEVPPPSPTATEVRFSAELRIEQGTEINQIQFRTNEASLQRLRELMDAFDAGLVGAGGKTYMTSAGVPLTFTSKSQVFAVYQAAILYRSAVLERSAQIQQLNPIPDPTQDVLWDTTRSLSEIMAELT